MKPLNLFPNTSLKLGLLKLFKTPKMSSANLSQALLRLRRGLSISQGSGLEAMQAP